MHTNKLKHLTDKQINMILRARDEKQAIRRFWVAYKESLRSNPDISVEEINESFEEFVDFI